ncbi:HAMP domain-containing histidine kinase [Hymenobacter sp. 5516J-16]|nr:HAMP domain-containing histidine kinase [Hymenobacter sp. 5516J-16]
MAGVAHEIQTPVSSVRKFAASSAELCTELRQEISNALPPSHDQEVVDEMLQNLLQNQTRILQYAQRADSIVRGMLEYSQNGTSPRQLTELNTLAEEYLRLAYHDLRAKNRYFNAALTLRLDPAVGPVQIVRQDVGRALVGIFSATLLAVLQRQAGAEPEEGYVPQVELRTHRTADSVEILVRDNGLGFSEEALATLFQRFPGPDNASADLGLPLSYDLITKGLGGQLSVSSTLHQGTEYRIILPLPAYTA